MRTTIERAVRQDVVLNDDVRPVVDQRVSPLALPQTRLFWD